LLVILAAGGGTRYEGPTHKLLAPWRGTTIVGAVAESAVGASAGPVVVVTGAVDLADAAFLVPVEVVRNDRWADGQATSLSLAVALADERGNDSVVVGLGDQPDVPPSAWRAVAEAPGGPIVAARFAVGVRPPVRLDRSVWPLLPSDGDEGARVVMRAHPDLVTTVDVPGDPVDIDTAEDLARWSPTR
jgi:CTP:molybdopterin cytidylyltransferase MocA